RNASKPDLVPLDPAARERAAFRLALSSRLLEALEMCATASPDHDNSPLSAAGVEVEGALLEGASAEESDCLSKPGQLIIGSGGWRGQPGEPAGRAELMELWSQLSGVVPGKVVSLRFDDAPSSSGAFPAVRPPVNAPADTRSARPSRPDLSSLAAAAGVTGR